LFVPHINVKKTQHNVVQNMLVTLKKYNLKYLFSVLFLVCEELYQMQCSRWAGLYQTGELQELLA